MANIVTRTEDFTHADWTAADNLIVTANTHAAPAFAGINAGMADKVEDASTTDQCGLIGPYRAIANDATDWVSSIYIRKDATTNRWPELGMQFTDGTGIYAGVHIDTSAGLVTNSPSFAPDASGIVDVDAVWWRVWIRKANNNTGNVNLRIMLFPSRASSFGGGLSTPITGFCIAWGANQTNTTTVQTYEPNPSYAFEIPAAIIFKNRLA